ncbi:MAG: pyrroloquinoline quinone-dependent dehydrogenase, partial [Gammaproteobacteria bacterium]|nr:pyrroloquinoline quinone-dependent dehydrogenase [Gammaproteobacteria bacterium]
PSPDFYGGERLGDNRYANSLVALNANTGQVVWHQQLVHHDVWDYDTPSQPTLTELQIEGDSIPAVLVVTKTGMIYAFHRETGAPLFDMIEREVPASDVPGERLSPTQPFSAVPPLADQRVLTPDDAFGIAWFDKRACAGILGSFRSEGIFTPPSLEGSIQNPSYAGGSNWGGVAVDTSRQIAVTFINQIPALVRLIPRDDLQHIRASGELDDWGISRMTGTPYYMARRIFLSPLGLPCTQPPWGKLVAVDLEAGQILWDIPLGTIADIAPAPVPNFEWGVPGMGGPLLTKSGLTVIGAAAEHALRVFDTRTGAKLWERRLPAAAMATPMSYEIDGVQYIAVAAGGHDQLGLDPGDYLIAFRLLGR